MTFTTSDVFGTLFGSLPPSSFLPVTYLTERLTLPSSRLWDRYLTSCHDQSLLIFQTTF